MTEPQRQVPGIGVDDIRGLVLMGLTELMRGDVIKTRLLPG